MKMIKNALKEKLRELRAVIRCLGSAVIAFSGGVDSTLLSAIAIEELGHKNILLVTAESETFTSEEKTRAAQSAKQIKARHVTIRTNELSCEEFRRNPPERCYFCKMELFNRLDELRRRNNFKFMADGTNADDGADFRPGKRAAFEKGVRSPLAEAGITKEMVRLISKSMGLSTWNLPAQACLASRVPYGTPLDKDLLGRIEKSEAAIRELCRIYQVRVRHHGDIARIEVSQNDIYEMIKDKNTEIVKALKDLGYKYVTVDMEGYRTGSMNDALNANLRF